MTDRDGAVYLERARIHVEDGCVIYHIEDDEHRREFNIPHVNLAVLFIGQGTSITQDAMRLLAEEGVHVAVTGSGGTPIHYGSLTTYTASRYFREMLPIYQSETLSLVAAKIVMRERVERMGTIGGKLCQHALKGADPSKINQLGKDFTGRASECKSIPELLGVEGAYTKACYKLFADLSGLSRKEKFRRDAGAGGGALSEGKDLSGRINRFIDHGNYLCYGMAGAALWVLGIPPHMPVFHGKTRAGGLVFDLADSFKDAFVLPLAFGMLFRSKERDQEKLFREQMINAFQDRSVLAEAIGTIDRMLEACRMEAPKTDA